MDVHEFLKNLKMHKIYKIQYMKYTKNTYYGIMIKEIIFDCLKLPKSLKV